MQDKLLTICIPTYNRESRLLKQLDSLYAQEDVYQTNIQIIDNHSDYDIESAIIDHFGKDKLSNLQIHINPVNLGLDLIYAYHFF
jgi:glycosyltransferase involved in cell wall biosynthesis